MPRPLPYFSEQNIKPMWWAVLSLLLAAVFWVLWAPIRLEINTWKGIYRAKWIGLGAVNWLPEEGVDVIEINLFFWKKRWALSETEPKQLPAKTTPKTTVVKKKKRRGIPWRVVKKIARTFKVRQCQFSFDTGNYLWNAWLFPVFWLWRSPNVSIWINFQGKNEGSLLVENRLGRLLWAMISSRVL